ncbi:HAMP domain-containing histidine kinase [Paenibacillus sp. GSMTC-2017]|uniref:HAMP domain-containing sensor histidine kinase n=1 Tax=Paenibacillus sp. GSMTC-2017 TaxID=2794350 RepID=UPI0018D9BBE2|nr:HAMP domain-containing sensor histidine kinase [Paenibacillus sp. GSMTC-2017]MBH5318346.1 HAMP domain-containing histidine kinase [Paenibacillus sp. GSMTC-2017]
MTKHILDHLNWRKSIRVRLFGSIIISFILTLLVSFTWDSSLYKIPFIGPVLSLILCIVVFFFFLFLLLLPVLNHLRAISDGLMIIAKGNLDYRVDIPSFDELGIISQNVNYMADQLQNMIQKERLLETSKMELITHVSHDLRTPLTSLIGYLNLLKSDDYSDLTEHKRYINNAYNKTEQLKKLIDDLFEYTRLTSGSAQLTFEPIDMNSLLDQIINEFEPIANENTLTVITTYERRPLLGMIDIEMFVRAIDNLLMNALKFSFKNSTITIHLAVHRHQLVISIENFGNPITKQQELRLFERFYKGDTSRSDKNLPQGSGLGLSIAKNIVKLHGGKINLLHSNGQFTFTILLPNHIPSE